VRKTSVNGDSHRVGRGVRADQSTGSQDHGVRAPDCLDIDLLVEVEVDITSLVVGLEYGGAALIGPQNGSVLTGTDVVGDKPGAYGKIGVGGGDGKELETLLATERSVNGWLDGAEEVTLVEYLTKWNGGGDGGGDEAKEETAKRHYVVEEVSLIFGKGVIVGVVGRDRVL